MSGRDSRPNGFVGGGGGGGGVGGSGKSRMNGHTSGSTGVGGNIHGNGGGVHAPWDGDGDDIDEDHVEPSDFRGTATAGIPASTHTPHSWHSYSPDRNNSSSSSTDEWTSTPLSPVEEVPQPNQHQHRASPSSTRPSQRPPFVHSKTSSDEDKTPTELASSSPSSSSSPYHPSVPPPQNPRLFALSTNGVGSLPQQPPQQQQPTTSQPFRKLNKVTGDTTASTSTVASSVMYNSNLLALRRGSSPTVGPGQHNFVFPPSSSSASSTGNHVCLSSIEGEDDEKYYDSKFLRKPAASSTSSSTPSTRGILKLPHFIISTGVGRWSRLGRLGRLLFGCLATLVFYWILRRVGGRGDVASPGFTSYGVGGSRRRGGDLDTGQDGDDGGGLGVRVRGAKQVGSWIEARVRERIGTPKVYRPPKDRRIPSFPAYRSPHPSHTLNELLSLKSRLRTRDSPSGAVTVLVRLPPSFFTDSFSSPMDGTESLGIFLNSLARQTWPPRQVILLASSENETELEIRMDNLRDYVKPPPSSEIMDTEMGDQRPWIKLRFHRPELDGVVAIVNESDSVGTNLILVVDAGEEGGLNGWLVDEDEDGVGAGGVDRTSGKGLEVLVRTSGTRAYEGSILSIAGLRISDNDDEEGSVGDGDGLHDRKPLKTSCLVSGTTSSTLDSERTTGTSTSSRTGSQITLTSQSIPIHIPSGPFLVQTSWLAKLDGGSGLRTDLSIAGSLALGLRTRLGHGGGWALPLPFSPSRGGGGGKGGFGREFEEKARIICESSLSNLVRTSERSRWTDVEEALETLDRSFKGTSEPSVGDSTALSARDVGRIAMMFGEFEELELSRDLACSLAGRHRVTVFVAGDDLEKHLDDDDSKSAQGRCYLDVRPLPTSAVPTTTESRSPRTGDLPPSTVLRSLASLSDAVDVVIYLLNGVHQHSIEAGLEEIGGIFKSTTTRAASMGREMWENRREGESGIGKVTVIGLPMPDVSYLEWMSALPIEALINWHKPRIDLSVITNNRPASFDRLMKSLRSAHYLGDEVNLIINLEQTADKITQNLADDIDWPFGPTTVRHRIILGSLMPAIVESWYPANNDTYGVLLEDDVEVSPFFYSWLKFTILFYRYYSPMRARSTRLFGVSLYQQRSLELRPEGRRSFDAHKLFTRLSLPSNSPYLSQIPCSWGAAYFPEHWKEFHNYLALRLSEAAMEISDIIVPDVRSNRWPRSWKKYFIEMVYMRGYTMLYPNFADFSSFSTNHLEKGTHIHSSQVDLKRKSQFEVPLMDRTESLLDLPDGKLPFWNSLPVTDLYGVVTTDEEIAARGWTTVNRLGTCPTPFRLDQPPRHDARELLCPREYERSYEIPGQIPPQPSSPLPSPPSPAAPVDDLKRIR